VLARYQGLFAPRRRARILTGGKSGSDATWKPGRSAGTASDHDGVGTRDLERSACIPD
jgi:hypothetical protein